MRRLSVILLLLVIAVPGFGDEFKAVVKGIEKHYGIRRAHPHLLGFALFLAKPTMWGSGAHSLKLAVFEERNRDFTASAADLDRIVTEALGPKWQPFVRVRSRKDGESSVIYTSFRGKQMRMMIASVEHGEISVVHIRISENSIRKWMEDPGTEARGRSHQHER